MAGHSALRASLLVWYLRLLQCLVSLAILAITVANISDWHGIECAIPRQLQINVSTAALSLPLIFYFLPATGPSRLPALPWSAPFQLILDFSLLCLWLIPSTFASYNCSEVCPSCVNPLASLQKTPSKDSGFFVWVGQLTCSCNVASIGSRDVVKKVAVAISRKAYLRPGKGVSSTKVFKGVTRIAAKRGMNWVMVSLLAITFLLTALAMYRRQQSSYRSSSRLVEYRDTKTLPEMESKKSDVSITSSPRSSTLSSPTRPSTPASFLSP